jgi:hypothetical protein
MIPTWPPMENCDGEHKVGRNLQVCNRMFLIMSSGRLKTDPELRGPDEESSPIRKIASRSSRLSSREGKICQRQSVSIYLLELGTGLLRLLLPSSCSMFADPSHPPETLHFKICMSPLGAGDMLHTSCLRPRLHLKWDRAVRWCCLSP